MEIVDKTGQLVEPKDFEEAIVAVSSVMFGAGMMKLSPELAVQGPNILRCLKQGLTLTKALREAEAKAKEKLGV